MDEPDLDRGHGVVQAVMLNEAGPQKVKWRPETRETPNGCLDHSANGAPAPDLTRLLMDVPGIPGNPLYPNRVP